VDGLTIIGGNKLKSGLEIKEGNAVTATREDKRVSSMKEEEISPRKGGVTLRGTSR